MARKMYDEDVELNEFHCNKKLQGHILSSREMKKAGFRELEDRWFYSRMLDKKADISFDVSIYKDNPTERVNIEVFDEDYGQHYDFQKYLNKNPHFEFALKIRNAVEMEMARLQEFGIISGHIKGEYI